MGCGCSKSEVVDQQQQQQVEPQPQQKKTITKKIIKKKKSTNNQESDDQDQDQDQQQQVTPQPTINNTKTNDDDHDKSRRRRPAPPKVSPFPDPLLKNLPWHSIRKACDDILDIMDDDHNTTTTTRSTNINTNMYSPLRFYESFNTLMKFRTTCGLFFATGDKENEDKPSFWKGRGYLRSGNAFFEEADIFNATINNNDNNYHRLCCESLALTSGELSRILGHLSSCVDVVLTSLLSNPENPKEVQKFFSLFVPQQTTLHDSNSNNNDDYTRSRLQFSSLASSALKSSFEKLVASNNLKMATTTKNNSEAHKEIQVPDSIPPMTPSLLDFLNNNTGTSASSSSWNLIIQSIETVMIISKIFRVCTSSSSSKRTSTNNILSHIITQSIYRFTGDPSAGMCSVMKLEEVLDDLKVFFASIGVLPSSCLMGDGMMSHSNNNNTNSINRDENISSHTSWFQHLPISCHLLSPQAVSVLLYSSSILYKQQRLTLKDVERDKILSQLENELKELSSLNTNHKNYLYKTSFRLSPMFKNEAGEGHGPRKDFYATCCAGLMNNNNDNNNDNNVVVGIPCFSKNSNNGVLWFDGSILDAGRMIGDDDDKHRKNNTDQKNQQQEEEEYDEDGFKVIKPAAVSSSATATTAEPASSSTIMTLVPFHELFSSSSSSSNNAAAVSRRFFTAGWLMGSAIVNGIPLVELPLPAVFFRILQKLVVVSASTIIVPNDFCEDDLLEVTDDMTSAISAVKKLTSTTDLIQYCEGIIVEGDSSDEDDDETIKTIEDALNSSKKCTSTTTKRLLQSSSSSSNIDKQRSFVILRHIVYPTLFEDYQKRWVALAAGFRASVTGPISCPPSFFTHTIDRFQLQGAIIGGAADSLDSVEKDFSFADSFHFNFDKEFSKFRFYFAFKKVILDALDLVNPNHHHHDHEEMNEGTDTTSSSKNKDDDHEQKKDSTLIEFKRKMLQFITGRKLVPSGESITVVLLSSPSTGWTIQDCIAQQSKKLPTAHTCTNTLEVPNYFEAVALEHLMTHCKSASFMINPTTIVDDTLREKIWDLIGGPASSAASSSSSATTPGGGNNNSNSSSSAAKYSKDQEKVRIKAHGLMLKMMKIAAYEGATFELDEMESTGNRDRHLEKVKL